MPLIREQRSLMPGVRSIPLDPRRRKGNPVYCQHFDLSRSRQGQIGSSLRRPQQRIGQIADICLFTSIPGPQWAGRTLGAINSGRQQVWPPNVRNHLPHPGITHDCGASGACASKIDVAWTGELGNAYGMIGQQGESSGFKPVRKAS